MNPLKIISMLMKPIEIALLAAGMGFVAYFTKEFHDFATSGDYNIDPYDVGQFGRYEFFMFSTGVGVGIAVLGLVGTLLGLLEKKHGALAMAAVQAIWTLQLIVSSALLAKVLFTYKKKISTLDDQSVCENWDKAEDEGDRKYHYTCGQLTGGVVCGFIGMVAFAVDTVISLFFYGQASHQYN